MAISFNWLKPTNLVAAVTLICAAYTPVADVYRAHQQSVASKRAAELALRAKLTVVNHVPTLELTNVSAALIENIWGIGPLRLSAAHVLPRETYFVPLLHLNLWARECGNTCGVLNLAYSALDAGSKIGVSNLVEIDGVYESQGKEALAALRLADKQCLEHRAPSAPCTVDELSAILQARAAELTAPTQR